MSWAEEQSWFGLEDQALEALYGSDYDLDSTHLSAEFISIPAWQCKDGIVIAIKDMSTRHIHRCIAIIKRSIRLHRNGLINHIWRLEYLKPLQEEINNRKFAEDIRNMSDDEFLKVIHKGRK